SADEGANPIFVGRGFSPAISGIEYPLPLALILLRNPRLAQLTSAFSVRVGGPRVGGRGSRLPNHNSRTGKEKALAAVAANRNTCQFRNRRNTLTTNDITFSNRNTIPVFGIAATHAPLLAHHHFFIA